MSLNKNNSFLQLQLIVKQYNAACSTMDNENICSLLEYNLQNYIPPHNEYEEHIKNILLNVNHSPTIEFKSNINNTDVKSLIKKKSCSNDPISCTKSENINEMEFNQFLEAFQPVEDNTKNRKVSKSLNRLENENQPYKSNSSSFRTAGEELQLQDTKKHPTNITQRKKLGFRRNINSKFISPLLSGDLKEEEKDQQTDTECVDERLKQIDPKMIELIKMEIMDVTTNVTWDDIAGLTFAKTAIQEAVVWPMLRPDIFTGLRRPPKGILLFGPPGTGKTLIGKCVASQSKSTFFSISASSLTSKWIGDGEKMVRALFAVARTHQPAVIFIDEIDSLLSQRTDTEHESSRRIKTEFLVQLDGATTDNEERILVIGATNRPQELDEAARRRFVKRLYIPLPEYDARLQLVEKIMSKERHSLTVENLQEIAKLSDGYSGADIRNLCAEAALGPIRSIDFSMIEKINANDVRCLLMEDFEKAFVRVRSSVSPRDLDQYILWDNTYGSGNIA